MTTTTTAAAVAAVVAVAAVGDAAGDAVGAGGDGNGEVAVAGDGGDPSRKGPSCLYRFCTRSDSISKRYTCLVARRYGSIRTSSGVIAVVVAVRTAAVTIYASGSHDRGTHANAQ